jgi:hypothetical protein
MTGMGNGERRRAPFPIAAPALASRHTFPLSGGGLCRERTQLSHSVASDHRLTSSNPGMSGS